VSKCEFCHENACKMAQKFTKNITQKVVYHVSPFEFKALQWVKVRVIEIERRNCKEG